jgi:hypothetical protein
MPLQLLPAKLCFEDTLRLLLHAALIDGHIQGASTWTDLEDLAMRRAKPTGTLLEFTAASQDLPLMPKVNHARSQIFEDAAMHYYMVSRHLRRLGKLCGFADVLKRYDPSTFPLLASSSARKEALDLIVLVGQNN